MKLKIQSLGKSVGKSLGKSGGKCRQVFGQVGWQFIEKVSMQVGWNRGQVKLQVSDQLRDDFE